MKVDSSTSREIMHELVMREKERKEKERLERKRQVKEKKRTYKSGQISHYKRMEQVKMEREIQKENIDKQLAKGEKTADLMAFREILYLPVIDTMKADQVANRLIEYMDICSKYDIKPGLEGMCLALGMSKWTYNAILTGKVGRDKETLAVFQQIQQMLTAEMEYYMQHGKINPACAIFIAKNNYGYRDQVETIVTKEEKEKLDADEIRAKYMLEEK